MNTQEPWKDLTAEDVQNIKQTGSGFGQFFIAVFVSFVLVYMFLSFKGLV